MMDDEKDWTAEMVDEHYNRPPATPRDEIWAALEGRLADAGRPGEGSEVVSLESRRRKRWAGAGWLAVAATAVLAAGIGIGRWSRGPAAPAMSADTPTAPTDGIRRPGTARLNRMAAVEHLSRSEPLLTLVKAEVARGGVDAEVAEWARALLGQTRFLLDSGLPLDPEVESVLEDLELILLQATLVASGEVQGDRARQELELLEEGLNERNVLPRIQAMIPTAGTGFQGS